MEVNKVCAWCGAPFTPRPDGGSRCEGCAPVRERQPGKRYRGTATERGYDARWDRLSKRARQLQPFCLDCGSSSDLTADHTPAAWKRVEDGKSIRLSDVDVVCRECNGKRGAARGERVGDGRRREVSDDRAAADRKPGGSGHSKKRLDPRGKA